MLKIKACLFDLDGVLVDTAKYHYKAWKELADELGFDFTEEHNERLKGVSRMASLDILLEIGNISADAVAREEMASRKNSRYIEFISKMTPDEILPGVIEFLLQLKKERIKIALGSASKNSPLILERVGITHFFDAIIDGNSVSEAKPNPEVFLKGAEALGVEPNQCVVFEDAAAGIEAARRGKMHCVGVGSPDILNDADMIIPGFKSFSVYTLLKWYNQRS